MTPRTSPDQTNGPKASRVITGLAVLTAVAVLQGTIDQVDREAPHDIDADRYLRHVRYLAADELEGRGNGSPGLEKAAEYIAGEFRTIGLAPGGDSGGYFQRFEIPTGLSVGPENEVIVEGARRDRWRLGEDYFPLSVDTEPVPGSASALETLPLVFAGYGISSPRHEYDDYAGIDVSGKAVLVFRHEPQEGDARSRFDGRTMTDHATFLTKAMTARARGARALLVVEDPSHARDTGNYPGFLADPQAESFGIPVLRVRRSSLERVLGSGIDLTRIHAAIDKDLTPRSSAVDSVSLTIVERYEKIRAPVRNVIGILPGKARPAEAIVIGAHYDHLGRGGRNSLAADAGGQIHNGADDNASGTAAIIEMARAAHAEAAGFDRTLVFVAFAGEELGLLGSAHYVTQPTRPLEATIAMLNLDMVGRPNGRILVSGLDTSPSLEGDLDIARKESRVSLDVREFAQGTNVGSSDDTSFLIKQVPSIGFFSGFHSDYHRPTDDWEKLDGGGAEVARLALGLLRRLASRYERPEFIASAAPHGSANPGGIGGYGPYFGSVPDFADDAAGVRFAEVRTGSPAAAAGLRAGDVLVRFDGAPVKTLYDFTFALRNKNPGDKVEVVVRREGREVTASVELGAR
jgi:hypothetical protein